MFTDRFIKVPTKVYNVKEAEIMGKQPPLEDSFSMIHPLDIQEYYESFDEGEVCTQIYLKNGRGFIVYLELHAFENLLNKHQSQ